MGATVIAGLGSIALLGIVSIFTDALADDAAGPEVSVGWVHFIGIVVFSPVAETALLLVMLRLLRRAGLSPAAAALVAALTWGCLHALLFPMWFFGTVWSFFVFSCAALAWQGKSVAHAFWAAALPHATINGAIFGVVAIGAGA